jgi:hypothetical protein
MIDPQQIEQRRQRADTRPPPGKPVGHVPVPTVLWITPALAIDGEIIRRHAGHELGLAGFIQ